MKHILKHTRTPLFRPIYTTFICLCLMTLTIQDVFAEQNALTILPSQCVAMQQGQDCYVTVELNWSSQNVDDYCLYADNRAAPLQCWKTSQTGMFKGEIKTKHSIDFQLSTSDRTVILSTAQLTVAWVHKKKGKPRTSWRLF